MKLAIINDTHVGARQNSGIFLDNTLRFFDEVFFPHLEAEGITEILHLGDLWDNRSSINFLVLNRFRQAFLNRLRDAGYTMTIIAGNHDCYYKNTSLINSLKETLGYYTDCVRIVAEPSVVTYGGISIGLVPWINAANQAAAEAFIDGVTCDVLAGHFEIIGYSMMAGLVSTTGFDSTRFKRFAMVLSGHYHKKSSQANIHYLGAQTEFYWSDCDDAKYFHVLDTEARRLAAIRNPHTLFKKIKYRPDYAVKPADVESKFIKIDAGTQRDSQAFDRFVSQIQGYNILDLKITESMQDFIGDAVDDDDISMASTAAMLNSYVDAVDTPLDKVRLKNKMQDLLKRAEILEVQ